ncbi:calcium-binding protein [Tistrella mobilis]
MTIVYDSSDVTYSAVRFLPDLVSPDGRLVLAPDKTQLLNLETGSSTPVTSPVLSGSATVLGVSGAGHLFVLSGNTVFRLDTGTGTTVAVMDLPASHPYVHDFAVSNDGSTMTISTIGVNTTGPWEVTSLTYYTIADGEDYPQAQDVPDGISWPGYVVGSQNDQDYTFKMSSDGDWIGFFAGNKSNDFGAPQGTIQFHNLETGQAIKVTPNTDDGDRPYFDIAGNAPIAVVVVASYTGSSNALRLVNLENGTQTSVLRLLPQEARNGAITAVKISPSGDYVLMRVTGDVVDDGPAGTGWLLYEIATGKLVRLGLPDGFLNDADTTNVRFGPDGDTILFSTTDVLTSDDTDGGVSSYVLDLTTALRGLTVTGTEGDDTLLGGVADDEMYGLGGNDVLIGSESGDLMDGGAGTDTADFSGSTSAVTVDLLSGTGIGGLAEGDRFVSIENIIGSAGADIFVSGTAGNRFDGAQDYDRVSYAGSTAAVTVDIAAGTASGGTAAGDTLISIEHLTGSDHADILRGSDGYNAMQGGAGNDLIEGRGGDDLLNGDDGHDTLRGGDGDDNINGGEGDDVLAGGAGVDQIFGGNGFDVISYEDATGAVKLDLRTGKVVDASGSLDTFVSIEGAYGSAYDDVLTGTGGDNVLAGRNGNDLLRGGAGADQLDGDAGNDTATYDDSLSGVEIDLSTGTGRFGTAQGDVLSGIENVIGSSFNDQLTGDDGGNRLTGGNGNDVLIGGFGNDVLIGGLGSDVLSGGNGGDFASYEDLAGPVIVDLATGQTDGAAAGDVLSEIEGLIGGAAGDRLSGTNGRNELRGGGGDDMLRGRGGADILIGGGGRDTALYAESHAAITVDLAAGTGIGGNAEGDSLTSIENVGGTAFSDTLSGDATDNTLTGYDDRDVLNGRAGDDVLIGGSGGDRLTGGTGADTFVFTSIADSVVGAGLQDVVFDFTVGEDRLDLSAIDGDPVAPGRQALRLLDGFDGAAGAVVVTVAADGANVVSVDIDGDRSADMRFAVYLPAGGRLGSGDFIFSPAQSPADRTLNGTDGDDVLTGGPGHDQINGLGGNDQINGSVKADTLDGGDGTDVVSYAASMAGVTVDLLNGTGRGGLAEGDLLINIENVIGSDYDDRFISGASPNTVNGGAGRDVMSYAGSTAAVTVGLGSSAIGGTATGDSLISIEVLEGSSFNDQLTGSTADDELRGDAGDDILTGGSGADLLNGGSGFDTASYAGASGMSGSGGVTVNLETGTGTGGNAEGDRLVSIEAVIGSTGDDLLIGSSGDDALSGGAGEDVLIGGAGADRLDGGNAGDTASYVGSSAGVSVDLGTGTGRYGDAEGDILTGISGLIGSSFDDTLTGNNAINTLTGGDGNDTLYGMLGDDKLIGGNGDDVLVGGDRNDTLTGGEGADLLDGGAGWNDTVVYTDASSGVIVNLTTGTGMGGAAGDILIGIEQIVGSAYSDKLTGSSVSNILRGGDGNDFLRGMGGGNTLYGDHGLDTVLYGERDHGMTIDLSSGTARPTAGAFADTLYSIENAGGTGFDDIITGDSGANRLTGYEGRDVLNGGGGRDVLDGGLGGDRLTGGSGPDTFLYNSIADSPTGAGQQDVIFDFSRGEDRIDLSRIDADTSLAGDQAFRFLGEAGLDGGAGALAVTSGTDGGRIVFIDLDGDGVSDMRFSVYGTTSQLTASDFVL